MGICILPVWYSTSSQVTRIDENIYIKVCYELTFPFSFSSFLLSQGVHVLCPPSEDSVLISKVYILQQKEGLHILGVSEKNVGCLPTLLMQSTLQRRSRMRVHKKNLRGKPLDPYFSHFTCRLGSETLKPMLASPCAP